MYMKRRKRSLKRKRIRRKNINIRWNHFDIGYDGGVIEINMPFINTVRNKRN